MKGAVFLTPESPPSCFSVSVLSVLICVHLWMNLPSPVLRNLPIPSSFPIVLPIITGRDPKERAFHASRRGRTGRGFMSDTERRMPGGTGAARGVLMLAACLASSGCVGPSAIRYSRMRYNEVYRATNDQQLLLNIVRLRYADSPVFIDLPNITSQFEVAGGASYPGKAGSQTAFGVAGLTGRDTPTLSYHPREGREVARALLTPLSAELFNLVNTGANTEQLLLMALNDINDVPNASRATTMVPKVPDDNAQFVQGIRLIAALLQRDAIELTIGTTEESDGASDPVPAGQVGGDDLLNAAKDGYVYRAKGDGKVTLLKREKELFLKIRQPYLNAPDTRELERVFHLTPGLTKYKIKSELSEDSNSREPLAIIEGETLFLNMRSILQIMTFLSKGVCVPEEHVVCGIAPTTLTPDGRAFDWTHITAGNFQVHSQKKRPRDTEVAVPYRGYWFFIPTDDVNTRAVLAILEMLFSLQEAEGTNRGPLLTLPVGG